MNRSFFVWMLFLGSFQFGVLTLNAQPSNLVSKVLPQLHLRWDQCYGPLIAEKMLPHHPNTFVVVIPKVVDSSDDYFSLDSYILLVNSKSGKIISRYYESSKTNGWQSDAIKLEEITIDTAPYLLKAGVRAFGIRVRFEGSSNPNPFRSISLSLFLQEGKTLHKILNNYEVRSYSGEWDTRCSGEITNETKTLKVSTKATNGYFDLLVSKETVHSVSKVVGDDCIPTETRSNIQQLLRYGQGTYK